METNYTYFPKALAIYDGEGGALQGNEISANELSNAGERMLNMETEIIKTKCKIGIHFQPESNDTRDRSHLSY